MNTLSRAITAQILDDSQTYHALRRRWSELINSDHRRELSAAHHLLYLALSGKDWRKSFTSPTNPRKLANGAFYAWRMFNALALFHSQYHVEWLLEPFDGIVTAQMLARMRKHVPMISPYNHSADEYTPGRFPFDAYNVVEAIAEREDADA
jgi:hypothetical protein